MDGERRSNRDRHADHADVIAPTAALGARQPAQSEDEADPGNQICEQHPGLAERNDVVCVGQFPRNAHAQRSRFLYMASIRAVTAKPPKIFTLASATATRPSHFELGL